MLEFSVAELVLHPHRQSSGTARIPDRDLHTARRGRALLRLGLDLAHGRPFREGQYNFRGRNLQGKGLAISV